LSISIVGCNYYSPGPANLFGATENGCFGGSLFEGTAYYFALTPQGGYPDGKDSCLGSSFRLYLSNPADLSLAS